MKKILVLTDFSKRAEQATKLALKIAKKSNSDVQLYHAFYVPQLLPAITEASPYYNDYRLIEEENLNRLQNFGNSVMAKMGEKKTEDKYPHLNYFNEPGTVGGNILDILHSKKNIWLIVMGNKSEKEGLLNDFIFGSNTYEVITRSDVPVLLVSEKSELHSIKTIAFASELDEDDYIALHNLVTFATFFDAKIIVTHVCAHKLSIDEKVNHIDIFNKFVKKVNYSNISYEDIRGEDVSSALAKFSKKEHIDMLAMQHKKHPFFERLFHHSITKDMLKYQTVPLLVLPSDRVLKSALKLH